MSKKIYLLIANYFQAQQIPCPPKRQKEIYAAIQTILKIFQSKKKLFILEEIALILWILHFEFDTFSNFHGKKDFMKNQLQVLSYFCQEETPDTKRTLH
jgi:hypothetical protein